MAKRRRDIAEEFDDAEVQMSPLIDLVFLLLIFFMTSSTMITYAKDERVKIPIAENAKVDDLLMQNRVVINVYADGSVSDERRTKKYKPADVTALMAQAKQRNPAIRLHLRADKRVPYRCVKEVIAASAEAGVNDVIISTYITEK
jgi:biopolymer transport protein ExbD